MQTLLEFSVIVQIMILSTFVKELSALCTRYHLQSRTSQWHAYWSQSAQVRETYSHTVAAWKQITSGLTTLINRASYSSYGVGCNLYFFWQFGKNFYPVESASTLENPLINSHTYRHRILCQYRIDAILF